jgi:hypothetical protein
MTTAAQHTAPEDIMALLDGELSAAEAGVIEAHIAECAECAAVADQFRETSHSLAAWTVPSAPETVDAIILEKSATRRASKPPTRIQLASSHWRRWALAGGGAVMVLLLFAIFSTQPEYKTASLYSSRSISPAEIGSPPAGPRPPAAGPMPSRGAIIGALMDGQPQSAAIRKGTAGMVNGALDNPTALTAAAPNTAAPMIARTVAMTLLVKDVSRARPALDAILSRYQGYAAELNINTPENYARSFGASLRIPAQALPNALADLRGLGRVQSESQSGEEVTQQHADLVARLKNARETEQRLLAILQQRTGKVSEVLEVEEQISTTRGDIERMEAEQKALEHRVDFATVQLQLTEEYKAQLAPPSSSVATRMHNSFVAGLANAGNSLLGILLFFEEFGPVLLVWLLVLGTPVVLLWRRYRKLQSGI